MYSMKERYIYSFRPATHVQPARKECLEQTPDQEQSSQNSRGKDKETLTYKTIGRPMANYAAPIFEPQLAFMNFHHHEMPQEAKTTI